MIKVTNDPAVLEDENWNFVDMHHHSVVSDGARTPEFLLKHFKDASLGLALTDHNYVRGSLFLSKQKDFFSIPAIELTPTQRKDVLAYFYDARDLSDFWEREVKPNLLGHSLLNYRKTSIDVFDLLDKIRDYNGVSSLAHPFVIKPKRSVELLDNPDFLRNLDCIESHNFLSKPKKKYSQQLLDFNKPCTAGTDSHRASGFNTLVGTKEFTVEGFLNAILKKKNIIYSTTGPLLHKLYEVFVVARNNISFGAKN